jgi:hypothetical protein
MKAPHPNPLPWGEGTLLSRAAEKQLPFPLGEGRDQGAGFRET